MSILQMGNSKLWSRQTEFFAKSDSGPCYKLTLKQVTGQEIAFAKYYLTAETHLFEGTSAGICNYVRNVLTWTSCYQFSFKNSSGWKHTCLLSTSDCFVNHSYLYWKAVRFFLLPGELRTIPECLKCLPLLYMQLFTKKKRLFGGWWGVS